MRNFAGVSHTSTEDEVRRSRRQTALQSMLPVVEGGDWTEAACTTDDGGDQAS
jgi:hypothetical protein